MLERLARPLSPSVFIMLTDVYKDDACRLHDNVSNLVDTLFEYHTWAVTIKNVVAVDLHDHHRNRALIVDELTECLDVLHRAMGLQADRVHGLQSDRLIDYAVGFVAQYFWHS